MTRGWAFLTAMALATAAAADVKEYKSGVVWPKPKVIQPGRNGGPPSDAVVLFDGKDMSKWNGGENWIVKNGEVTAAKGSITTKQAFGDCQLHVEWATPEKVEGNGQGRGNSGIFLMNKYEIQVLDSYNNETYYDGQAGSVYKQHPPMVNACRKPGEWQTYDIIFTAPRFAPDGKLQKPAYVTVIHNGVLVQNHFELTGDTSYVRAPLYAAHPARLPIELQFHGNPVRYRNIWLREVPPMESIKDAPKEKPAAEKPATDKPKADKPKSAKKPEQFKGDQKPNPRQ